MPVYCDASLLVSLYVNDASTDRARRFIASGPVCCISDFAAAEVASAVARLVRMGALTPVDARSALALFDRFRAGCDTLETSGPDIDLATQFIRRLDLPLRTSDALNLALATRANLPLVTFDEGMRVSAAALGLALHPSV